MSLTCRRERSSKFDGGVSIRASGRNGVAENLATVLLRAVRSLDRATLFYPAKDGEQVARCDLHDRAPAEVGEDVVLKTPKNLVRVTLDPFLGEAGEPFPGDGFETVGGALGDYGLVRLALLARIDAVGE